MMIMNNIDRKYTGILSAYLDNFKVMNDNPYKANCRCPICGDSKKSKSKARGWILDKEKVVLFYCHNCGASLSFGNLIKNYFPILYNDYLTEKLVGKYQPKDKKVNTDDKFKTTTLFDKPKKYNIDGLIPIEESPPKIREYLNERNIPKSTWYRLGYVENFSEFTNKLIPDKLSPKNKEDRLVIPFYSEEGELFGYQGRALDNQSKIRYITIILNYELPKVYGLDKVDFNKTYYVLEGPIDSMFLDNAVALAGADGDATVLKNLHNAVFVFDVEPRNPEIVKRMLDIASKGYNIAVIPSGNLGSGKDINDFINDGFTKDDIRKCIDDNTYSGLSAEFEINNWAKI
jgi:transcription elongation factor Elf1